MQHRYQAGSPFFGNDDSAYITQQGVLLVAGHLTTRPCIFVRRNDSSCDYRPGMLQLITLQECGICNQVASKMSDRDTPNLVRDYPSKVAAY